MMHRTDAFMELVAYVVYFLLKRLEPTASHETGEGRYPAPPHHSENVVKRGLFTQEDYDLGRFMICVLG